MNETTPLQLPHMPDFDAAAIVDEVGERVTDVSSGDAVFGLTLSETFGGATAEFAIVEAWAPIGTAAPQLATARGAQAFGTAACNGRAGLHEAARLGREVRFETIVNADYRRRSNTGRFGG